MTARTLIAFAVAFAALVPPAAVTLAPRTAEGAAARPDWCGAYKSVDDTKAKWVDGYIKSEHWSVRVRNYIGASACDKPDDPMRQALVETWRSQFLAENGGTAKDFSEMIALHMNKDEVERQRKESCDALRGEGSAESKRAVASSLAYVFDCPTTPTPDADDLLWWTDKPNAPELVKTLLVRSCISTSDDFGLKYKSGALCLGTTIDRARLDAEINVPRFNVFARTRLREAFGQAKLLMDGWIQRTQAAGKQNPDMQKIFVDAPAAGARAWQATYQGHKEALDLAFDLEEKLDVSAAAQKGCSARVRGLLAAYMQEKKPRTVEEARKVLADSVGYPLATNLMKCDVLDGAALETLALSADLYGTKNVRKMRGPGFAAYWAALDAYTEAKSASRQLPINNLPDPGDYADRRAGEASSQALRGVDAGGGDMHGVVAALKPEGDNVKVTFKKEQIKVYDEACETDYRTITGFGTDGSARFATYCRTLSTFTMHVVSEDPVVIAKAFAGALVVGQKILFIANRTTSPRAAFPTEVYADKEQKNLVAYLGIPLARSAAAPSASSAGDAKPSKAGAKKRVKGKKSKKS